MQLYIPDFEKNDKWEDFFECLKIDKMILESILEAIAKNEAPVDAVVRLISSGRSGARVVVLSYHNQDKTQSNWLVKIFPPGLEWGLQKELKAYEEYACRIHQNSEVRTCAVRTIAYRFVNNAICDFDDWLKHCLSSGETEQIIRKIFSSLAPFYENQSPHLLGFFECYKLNHDVTRRVTELKRADILTYWNQLKKQWPVTRGILQCLCHGDLNPTNILLLGSNEKQETFIIDFAETGFAHWSSDFVRLERQIKFFHYPGDSSRLCGIVDQDFDFAIPSGDPILTRFLSAIRTIRDQARLQFATRLKSNFQGEYLTMAAFQQLCLLTSQAWPRSEVLDKCICDSTASILECLLKESPIDYFFGYFFVTDGEKQQILVKKDASGLLEFPFSGFPDTCKTISETIENEVLTIFKNINLPFSNLFECHFGPIQLTNIDFDKNHPFILEIGPTKVSLKLTFFQIELEKKLDLRINNYIWVNKNDFIKTTSDNSEISIQSKIFIDALLRNKICKEFGERILECVDILVFREHKGEYQFLMLHRNVDDEPFNGWEYPKGGLRYHETPREGALRELLEDTGIDSTGGFRYGGSLGYQTVDVAWRKQGYSALRVRGVTFLFYGREEDITLKTSRHGHTKFQWMTREDALKNIWLGEYGQEFFNRWLQNKNEIIRRIARPVSIAFQITEKCHFSCKFCLRRQANEVDLNFEEACEVIDILSMRNVLRLTITGGEPLIKSKKNNTLKLLEYAHSKKIHTCLSTTGYNIEKTDVQRLIGCVDQLLLSLHNPYILNDPQYDNLARGLYNNPVEASERFKYIENILEWTQNTPIKIQVNTMVCKINFNFIVTIGKWLFSKRDDLHWRIDEYYANGEQLSNRDEFELNSTQFSSLKSEIKNDGVLAKYFRQIAFSDKDGRMGAPDFMITPHGNLVTSSNNEYYFKGELQDLIFCELKNRRSWREYRDCIRTDWKW